MSFSAIRRDLQSSDPERLAQGLRRLTKQLAPDAISDQRPTDWQQRKAALADMEPSLLKLAESEDEVVRELATDALGAWHGDAAFLRVLALTEDPIERVRASAIGALEGWPDSAQALEKVIDAVDAPQWTVRMRGARALWPFAGADVDKTLFGALVDPDSYVRMNAADSLRKRNSPDILAHLRSLHDYTAPHMLDAALDLLGQIGTREDIVWLEKAGSWLNLSQPAFVRAWSRDAAKKIRKRLNKVP